MPQPTYTALATVTVASNISTVSFGNIPNTYRDLILVTNMKADQINEAFVTFNGSSSDFSGVRIIGSSSGASSNTYSSNFGILVTETGAATFITQIMDYSATDKHKTLLTRQNRPDVTAATAFRWANTAAITSIAITPQSPFVFVSGATFSLYGVIA
jgi:hypothetical protein